MRHRETAQSGFGLRAAAGRRLVADLAAGAGRRPRKRRDRRGVVVGLALHHRVRELVPVSVAPSASRIEAGDGSPFDHRGVVGVGHDRSGGIARVRGLDHPEESLFLRSSIDDPRGIEDLVPAMLRVRLSEHRELHIGGVAGDLAVVRQEVVDFVGRESEPEGPIGLFEGRAPSRHDVHDCERPRIEVAKQRARLIERAEHGFCHAVVNELEDPMRFGIGRAAAGKEPRSPALDAAHRFEAASARELGRLRRPRRDRAQARHAEKHAALARGRGLAVPQQALEHLGFARGERPFGFDEMPVFGRDCSDRRLDRCEAGVEFVEPESGNGAAAA